jgi:Fic family protein
MREVQEIYTRDAYHSLSIEGYRVTPDLIRRIADGNWNPDDPADRKHADAMAARGYFDAFQLVKESVRRVLNGANAGEVFSGDLQPWYRALFGPSVQAGALEPWQLAGYRDRAVYIAGSSHVPPPREAVAACVDVLCDRLREEPDPLIRAVLGHFLFVFIHPYPDGNGRLGRFLMNLQLASGGYPWTVVRIERRSGYMDALEQASTGGDIAPFNAFLAEEMTASVAFHRK